jgi:hypothetical protein
MHTLGDGPVQEEFMDTMRGLGRAIDVMFNGPPDEGGDMERNTGFVLMVFPFGDELGRCNYMSNAERGDVVRLLKEQIHYFEAEIVKEALNNPRGHA